jgi:hypothetical protein
MSRFTGGGYLEVYHGDTSRKPPIVNLTHHDIPQDNLH